MTIRLYCDEDSLRYALVQALRTRGVDITTTVESQMAGATAEQQLAYATAEGRTIYT